MLTLICGLPNAGKTTHSERYDNVIHYDAYQRHGIKSFEACNHAAASVDGDVCVEGVYNSAKERQALIEACKEQSPKVCIWIDTDVDECIRREQNYRCRPLTLVIAHAKAFQPPTLDEGWDVIIKQS